MARPLTDDAPGVTRVRFSDFADGVRAITPMVVGVVPFGIAIGAVAADAELPTTIGWAGSLLLLGGSAQLTIIQLLDGGSAAAAAIVAALLINSRFLVYGAGIAAWFPTTSTRGRLLLAAPLVDQLYLTTTTEFQATTRDERARRHFYAGAALHLWMAFVTAQTIGALVGQGVPSWVGLEAASPIALSGLLAVAMSNRAATRAAVAAGAFMAVTSPVGAPSLMIVALLIGIAFGRMSRPAPSEAAA
jgi:predicted branched-subunit amino acid permease